MDYVYGYFVSVILHINLFIYEGIKSLYNLMLYIAESQIVSNEMISSFSSRIYVLLGIFMLFKLSFSLITYVINPDEFFDKTKGITSIGKNIIISLVLIVLTPYLFQEARELQTNILNEHVIENLVFGNSRDSYTSMNEGAKTIQFQLFAQWVRPNKEIKELKDCGNLFVINESGNYETTIVTEGEVSYAAYVLNEECMTNLDTQFKNSKNGDSNAYKAYRDGLEQHNIAYFYNDGIFTARTTDKKNIIAYDSLFSIISGIIVVFILISFCFDIAVRAIKLAFFQIIAPIPIISLCDPKGKDGMFKKWGTAVIKTYLSLFLRLVAIDFSISIMQQILVDPKWHSIESVTDGFATAFIIIGALMFAKQLPGIISEITGIKLDSKFNLNPFKRIENDALGGKAISSVGMKGVGLVGGAGIGLAANTASLLTGKGFHLKGLTAAMSNGFKGKKIGEIFGSSYGASRQRHKQLQDMEAEGVNRGDVFGQNFATAFGRRTKAEKVKEFESKGKVLQDAYERIKNQMIACDKDDGTVFEREADMIDEHGNIVRGIDGKALKVKRNVRSAKTIQKELDELKKTTIDREAFRDAAINNVGVGATNAQIDAELNKLYNEAVTSQKERVRLMEEDLEYRINQGVAGLRNGSFKTSAASADNIIKEQQKTMEAMKKDINDLAAQIDGKAYGNVDFIDATDVVTMMKQGKGVAQQASSGEFQHAKDVDKYANQSKKDK